MKILIVVMVLVNIAFSKSIIYDLKADGKQIGTLSVKTENLENKRYNYRSDLKFSGTYMFFKYTYAYRENAFFDKNGLEKYTVEEFSDDNQQMMSGKRVGSELVFGNGKRIKLSQIDVTPFDINLSSKYDDSNIKNFTLKTFDGLTGELVDEFYQVSESQKVNGQACYVLEKRNSKNDEVEKLTITKGGELIGVVGEEFKMTLRTKGKQ